MNKQNKKANKIIAYINLDDENESMNNESSLDISNEVIKSDVDADADADVESPEIPYPIFVNCNQGKPIIHNEEEVTSKANLRYDIVRRIIKVKQYKNHQIIFKVSFRKRPSGKKPRSRWYTSTLLKMYAPLQLCEFYEKILNKNIHS